VLPQFEVVTLRYLGERVPEYARIRVWGSIGFIVTVVIVGMLVDLLGPIIVLPVLFGIYLALWISSMVVKDPDPEAHPTSQPSILSLLKLPAVIAFFIVCFLMQTGHGVYYAFYSIYMESVGYSKTIIGQLWALGVVAEVVVFLFMHRVLQRWGARRVLMVSLLLAAVRWLLIGNFPDSMSLILTAQLLHAATFGSFHAASIHLVNHYFTGRHQGRGQALYSGLSYGAGGALGTLASGFLWDSAGPTITYGISALISLLALAIAWRYVADRIE
jgi:PPP family 3-phenylpropionic acid transporter